MPDAPISWGELVDKITILRLKAERLTTAQALSNVSRELAALDAIAADVAATDGLAPLVEHLAEANAALWDIEDGLREKERDGDFGEAFVDLARSVYRLNDRRAALKRQINLLLKSEIVEEKSYAGGGG